MIKYQEPLFRPPAEHDSLIFQVAYSCPHNSCSFCQMYKSARYQVRPIDEVLIEIGEAARTFPSTRRIFLADGDVMFLKFDDLKIILLKLNESFPRLARVNVYANGTSILAKSRDELEQLRKLKLTTLYLGLETGDGELLRLVNKTESVDGMVSAVRISQDCGFRCSVMALLGLAGRKGSMAHAKKTAEVLNQMQPRLLSFLRFIEVPGVKMFEGYETVSEYEAVEEMHRMIEGLELDRAVFRANHSSNPIPLEGRFPQDKERLLIQVKSMLDAGILDQNGPGAVPFML